MATATANGTGGRVVQVIGPVIDVEFPESVPEIYSALEISEQGEEGALDIHVVAEVQQHIGRNQVRAVAMSTTDGVIRGTDPQPSDMLYGRAVEASYGAVARLERVLIEANHEVGIDAIGPGGEIVLGDVTVRDTQPLASDGLAGHGATAVEGGVIELREVVFERNHDVGLFVLGAGSAVRGSDVIVRETRQLPTGDFGLGVLANRVVRE